MSYFLVFEKQTYGIHVIDAMSVFMADSKEELEERLVNNFLKSYHGKAKEEPYGLKYCLHSNVYIGIDYKDELTRGLTVKEITEEEFTTFRYYVDGTVGIGLLL